MATSPTDLTRSLTCLSSRNMQSGETNIVENRSFLEKLEHPERDTENRTAWLNMLKINSLTQITLLGKIAWRLFQSKTWTSFSHNIPHFDLEKTFHNLKAKSDEESRDHIRGDKLTWSNVLMLQTWSLSQKKYIVIYMSKVQHLETGNQLFLG